MPTGSTGASSVAGLDEGQLPAGSVVEFRNPSVWDLYKWWIAGGASFLLQTALVVGLLANRARRRRAETARQESERRRQHARRRPSASATSSRTRCGSPLGELTASFAHEAGQPLTAIAANAQAARRLLAADQVKPDVKEALDDVAADAIRASETIRRLQALFRKQPAARALDINALIEDVLRLLATDIRSRHIVVQFVRGEQQAVLGDGIQLRQVVINVLVNAAEAITLAGNGLREIGIETSRPDAAHVAIAIRDRGIGVKESDLERIFEHFVSSKPQGLGMGLAISRSIVEAHGGRIWATRNDGRGTTLRRASRAAEAQAGSGLFDGRSQPREWH